MKALGRPKGTMCSKKKWSRVCFILFWSFWWSRTTLKSVWPFHFKLLFLHNRPIAHGWRQLQQAASIHASRPSMLGISTKTAWGNFCLRPCLLTRDKHRQMGRYDLYLSLTVSECWTKLWSFLVYESFCHDRVSLYRGKSCIMRRGL